MISLYFQDKSFKQYRFSRNYKTEDIKKKKIKLKLFRASNLGRVSCNKQSPCKKDKEALLPGHLPWMADPSLLSLVLSYQLIMLY